MALGRPCPPRGTLSCESAAAGSAMKRPSRPVLAWRQQRSSQSDPPRLPAILSPGATPANRLGARECPTFHSWQPPDETNPAQAVARSRTGEQARQAGARPVSEVDAGAVANSAGLLPGQTRRRSKPDRNTERRPLSLDIDSAGQRVTDTTVRMAGQRNDSSDRRRQNKNTWSLRMGSKGQGSTATARCLSSLLRRGDLESPRQQTRPQQPNAKPHPLSNQSQRFNGDEDRPYGEPQGGWILQYLHLQRRTLSPRAKRQIMDSPPSHGRIRRARKRLETRGGNGTDQTTPRKICTRGQVKKHNVNDGTALEAHECLYPIRPGIHICRPPGLASKRKTHHLYLKHFQKSAASHDSLWPMVRGARRRSGNRDNKAWLSRELKRGKPEKTQQCRHIYHQTR